MYYAPLGAPSPTCPPYGCTHDNIYTTLHTRGRSRASERNIYDRWHTVAVTLFGFPCTRGRTTRREGSVESSVSVSRHTQRGKVAAKRKGWRRGECRDAARYDGRGPRTEHPSTDRLFVSPPSRRVEGNGRGPCHRSIGRPARRG